MDIKVSDLIVRIDFGGLNFMNYFMGWGYRFLIVFFLSDLKTIA